MVTEDDQRLEPAIIRVRLDKLTIFEITEAELAALERGSPESIFLNLAIGALSVAVSFTIALVTSAINSQRTHAVFVIVAVVGYVAALTFSLLWWQAHRSLRSVAKEIRGRRAPEGTQVTPTETR